MQREKVTITLRADIIKKVDETIDGGTIRNRSHAIEYLLTKSLAPRIQTALILAGGKGTKMKPLTEELPKPLLPVNGKPIIEHQIELLRSEDIRNIFIVVGYLGEKIKYHIGDGSKFGVRVQYIEQGPSEVGTGYAVYLAKNFVSGNPFLALYGDILVDINLKDFIDHHSNSNLMATLALTSMKDPSPYGVAKLRGGKIMEFVEKPKEKAEMSRVISAGLFCFEPKIFDELSSKKDLALEKDVFPALAKEGELGGYVFEGKWFDIGTPEIYARAIKEWSAHK